MEKVIKVFWFNPETKNYHEVMLDSEEAIIISSYIESLKTAKGQKVGVNIIPSRIEEMKNNGKANSGENN